MIKHRFVTIHVVYRWQTTYDGNQPLNCTAVQPTVMMFSSRQVSSTCCRNGITLRFQYRRVFSLLNSNHIRRTNKRTRLMDLSDSRVCLSICPFVVDVLSYGSRTFTPGHLPSDKPPSSKSPPVPGHAPGQKPPRTL